MTIPTDNLLREPLLLKGFFSDEVIKQAREAGKLLTATTSLYPECVNKCLFCGYAYTREKIINNNKNQQENKRIKIDIDEYSKIFKELSKLGVRTIFIPGLGEPLLQHEEFDIVEYIKSANKEGLYVVIISSLNPEPSDEIIAELKTLDVSIIAKLESLNPEKFVQIVNPSINNPYNFVEIKKKDNYSYGHVTAGIKKLMDAGFNIPDKNGQVRLGSGTVINNINKDEIANIFRFYRDFNIWPYIQLIKPAERALEQPELYKGLNKLEMFKMLLTIDEKEYGYTWDIYGRRAAYTFIHPTLLITFGGIVNYDVYFRINFGKIFDNDRNYIEGSITKIADSREARWLRNIYFPIGGAEGCCQEDHSKCGKIILDAKKPISQEYLAESAENPPDKYCIFSSVCTKEAYTKKS